MHNCQVNLFYILDRSNVNSFDTGFMGNKSICPVSPRYPSVQPGQPSSCLGLRNSLCHILLVTTAVFASLQLKQLWGCGLHHTKFWNPVQLANITRRNFRFEQITLISWASVVFKTELQPYHFFFNHTAWWRRLPIRVDLWWPLPVGCPYRTMTMSNVDDMYTKHKHILWLIMQPTLRSVHPKLDPQKAATQ